MTCWRRLAEWTRAGVWPRAARGSARQGARCERPGLLSCGGRRLPHPGVKGGPKTGRIPVNRGRTGSEHRLIADATGISLAATLTGGNRNDVTQLIPLLRAVPPVRGKRGRPRRRPDVVLADLGYDHDKYRRLVWDLGVKRLIARRGTEHGSGLGTQRWVVEGAFAHLRWFRRLRIRWEIRGHIHEAFLTLGCALICWRRLRSL
ncbi:IS5 family transposase [Streptomyces sp. NPDC051954]|uniref:IS5 family transposase n=1 Tax=Streptomyces sp. NPDC051954 TaxID=3155524 RepID=UPI00343A22CF